MEQWFFYVYAIHHAPATLDENPDILHVTAHGKFGLKIGCQKNAGMTGLKLIPVVLDVRKER